MHNMRLIVLLTVLLLSEIKLQNLSWLRPQGKACEDFKDFYYDTLERCLKTGQVVDKDLQFCYELNSKGPCKSGENLVFSKGPCLQTECVANRDRSGNACPDGWFNYNGTCTEAGSQDCAGQFGRRVRPDLYGDVQCVCDQQLGFVEFEGECHFEFLQGPCQPGEQLITDISGSLETKCVENTCENTIWFMLARPNNGTQHVCYEKDEFVKQFNTLLLTEAEANKLPPVMFSAILQPSCKTTRAEINGECLGSDVEPGMGPIPSLLFEMKTKFKLAGPPQDQQDNVKSDDLVFVSLLVNGTKVDTKIESWLLSKEAKECQKYKGLFFEAMGSCLETGLVFDKNFRGCNKLHSKGPCSSGDILVFSEGPCLQTECVSNRDSSGIACPDGWFNYNGTCTEAGSQDCAGQFGRRVRPDLYGKVQCVCDQQLGFVDFEGECHFEFLQGPCQDGEQLITDISGSQETTCVQNTCSEGRALARPVNGAENVCHPEFDFLEKLNRINLTKKEKSKVPSLSPRPLSTIEAACFSMSAVSGECLIVKVEPGVISEELLKSNLKRDFNQMLPDEKSG